MFLIRSNFHIIHLGTKRKESVSMLFRTVYFQFVRVFQIPINPEFPDHLLCLFMIF